MTQQVMAHLAERLHIPVPLLSTSLNIEQLDSLNNLTESKKSQLLGMNKSVQQNSMNEGSVDLF